MEANKMLWRAMCNGDAAGVEEALKRGVDIHAQGIYALAWAAWDGQTEVVRILLDHGANVHENNDAALRSAAEYGYIQTVKLLLDHGADVYAGDDSALRRAAKNGHTEVVKLLQKRMKVKQVKEIKVNPASRGEELKVTSASRGEELKVTSASRGEELKVTSAPCGEMYDNLCALAEYYGLELQICKTLEELGELSAALARRQLDQNDSDVLEEIADVYNMLDQLCILLDCEDEVADIAESKILRQLKRIENEQGASGEESSAQ